MDGTIYGYAKDTFSKNLFEESIRMRSSLCQNEAVRDFRHVRLHAIFSTLCFEQKVIMHIPSADNTDF